MGSSNSPAKDLELSEEETLKVCTSTKNCYSSQSPKSKNYVSPLTYKGERRDVFVKVKDLLNDQDKATFVSETDHQLHYTFFAGKNNKYTDDVNLAFEKGNNVIHIRSASRVGIFDFGVNKKRIEMIRKLLENL